jgi:D-alanyl-D-alanine carboxypeptidase/D-alanyl-D-alanine-endopeptidase (penicillin-binding protein 4)
VMPASNQKLLSCAFALYELGPDFVPKTRIWKLKDRIIVESNGDPSLTYQQLTDAKKALKLNGKLPVYVKQAYRVGIPDSWEVDDLPNRYAAPVSAFCFDQAAFELWAERGRAFLLPASFGIRTAFDPSLAPGATRYDPLRRTVRVGKNLPAKRTRLDTIALPSADECAAMVLGNRFFSTQTVPTRNADLTIKGQALPEILKTCLVKSDNIMAENLLLMAASHQGDLKDKVYTLARERVTKFLTETVGVDKQDLRIYDGSGLSRHNLVNARAISKLLVWANKQPTAELWKSCLVSPLNGTLRSRLKDVAFRGKTGTLDMVVCLSGYVKNKAGEERIMSVLLNHFTSSPAKARDIADNFAKTAAEGPDGARDALSSIHEACSSLSCYLSASRYRSDRSNHDGRFARTGTDHRAKPAHEASHRDERMALHRR